MSASTEMATAQPVRAVAASVACLTASIMPGFLTGALGSDIGDEFGFGDTGLGIALAVSYGLAAVASVHAGAFSDQVGARKSLMLALWVAIAGYLAVALLASSLPTLLVSLGIAGAGLTLTGPAAKVLVANHVSPQRYGIAFGIHMSAIPLAPLLAGLAVPLLGDTVGWRWAYVGGAVLAGIGMLMIPPERVPESQPGEARDEAEQADIAAGRFQHVRLAPLFVFGTSAMLAASAVISATTFFVVNSEDAGIAEDTAGLLLSAVAAGVIGARIGFGAIADRRNLGTVGVVASLMAASAGGYVVMATDTPLAYALGGLVAIILGWSWPGLMVLALVRANPHAPGLVSAFVVGGLNLGSVVGPAVFGVLSDAASSSTALLVTAVWALCAAAACMLGRLMQSQ